MGTRTSSPSCRRRPPNSHSLTSRSSPRVKLSHRLGTSADSTFQSEFPISDSSHSHAWSRQYDHVPYFTVQYSTLLYCVSMFQRGLAQYMGCCLTAFAHHPKARVILATERYSLIDFILFRYFIICTTHM